MVRQSFEGAPPTQTEIYIFRVPESGASPLPAVPWQPPPWIRRGESGVWTFGEAVACLKPRR